jgi:hypothetical protein
MKLLTLHRVSAIVPGAKPAFERTHLIDASSFQKQRHPGTGCFAWSGAEQHNFPVTRNLLVPFLYFVGS